MTRFLLCCFLLVLLSSLLTCEKDLAQPPGNQPPVFNLPLSIAACADSVFRFEIMVADPDGDTLQLQAQNLPAWLSLNAAARTLEGRPGKYDLDSTAVKLMASDGNASVSAELRLIVTTKSDFAQRLQTKLQQAARSLTPGLRGVSVAVATPDLGIVTATCGKSAPWNNSPALHAGYGFRVASVTKTFTAALILKMARDGLLRLDDTLAQHLPDTGIPHASQMTIRQLLSHSAGVRDHFNGWLFLNDPRNKPYKVWSPAEIFKFAARSGAAFKPGASYAYSNTGFYLLGALAEKKYKQPLALIFKEQLLNPLALNNTFYDDFSSPSNKVPNLAENRSTYKYHLSAVGAAGAMVSTPSDLAKFAKTLYGCRFLDQVWVCQMTADTGSSLGGEPYGLGTRLWNVLDIPHCGHTGYLMDYRTILMYVPESDVAIAICAHDSHPKWGALVDAVFKMVVEEY